MWNDLRKAFTTEAGASKVLAESLQWLFRVTNSQSSSLIEAWALIQKAQTVAGDTFVFEMGENGNKAGGFFLPMLTAFYAKQFEFWYRIQYIFASKMSIILYSMISSKDVVVSFVNNRSAGWEEGKRGFG